MKITIITAIALATIATTADARGGGHSYGRSYSSHSSVSVRGYTTKNGTYVAPSHRTAPDSTRANNWSSRPNVNPYTGKIGTKDPYAVKP